MSKPPNAIPPLQALSRSDSVSIHLFKGRLSPGRTWQIQRKLETHILYVLVEGQATLEIGETLHPLNAPCAVLLPQATEYTLSSTPSDPVVFYPIHFTTLDRLQTLPYQILTRLSTTDLIPLIDVILFLWQTETAQGIIGAASGLATLLAYLEAQGSTDLEQPSPHQGIQKVCDYLRYHPEIRTSVPDLARMAGMGRSNFSHHFTQVTGLSPHQYAIRERCRTAEDLIREEGFRVSEAATATGYTDPFSFSKQFKHVMGYSPSTAGKA